MFMKKIITTILASAVLVLTTSASASTLQQIQIANMLYNFDGTAGNPGVTASSVVVKLYTGGAFVTPCYTATIPYQSDVSITVGTGQSCTALVTGMSVAPVASATAGILYTAPSNVTVNADYTQQFMIEQSADSFAQGLLTSHGPVFDTTNGLVATPGTVLVGSQHAFHKIK